MNAPSIIPRFEEAIASTYNRAMPQPVDGTYERLAKADLSEIGRIGRKK